VIFVKILLTGTICVGKSTLVEYVASVAPKRVTVIPEVARELLAKNPDLERLPEFQDILFREQVDREQAALESAKTNHHHLVLCDRGVLDIIAFSRMFGHEIRNEWIAWSRSYDRVYVLLKENVTFNSSLYSNDRDWLIFRDTLQISILDTINSLRYEYKEIGGSTTEMYDHLMKDIDNNHEQ
jgi:predicted ATPase